MDYLVRATAADLQIRAFAVTSKELVEQAGQAHQTSPVATAALGRTMSGALMMADSMLKNEEDVMTIQINGDGPLGGIVVTADHHGHVKGYVHQPEVYLPDKIKGHLDVGGAVGKGTLTVIRDMGMKDPYVGQIELASGEIGDDLTSYFAVSEQIPSSVGLGVLVAPDRHVLQAGGFIVQLMPFASEETISRLEENLKKIDPVTEMLQNGLSPEDMLEKILDGWNVERNGRTEVSFSCDCSRERVERALILLGKKEIGGLIREGKEIELGCSFCGKKYSFTPEDLLRLQAEAHE